MEELIRFRLSINQLDNNEFNVFVNKCGKDQIISLMLKSFLFMRQHSQNPYNQITNINDIISNITQSRTTKKSSDSNTSDESFKINKLSSALIRECSSYLNLIDYLSFSQCDGLIYVSCHSPVSLYYLDMSQNGYPDNLNKFRLLKRVHLVPAKFNKKYNNFSLELNNITHLSLDMCNSNNHAEIETLMNATCIRFTQITKLNIAYFGSENQPYDFYLFLEFLKKFPIVNCLAISNIYFDQFTNELNIISQLLPQLKELIFESDDTNANIFANKLIDTHSKQIHLHSDLYKIEQREQSPDFTNKNIQFEFKHWLMLFQLDPQLYEERLAIKQDKEALTLAELWGADITRHDADGNCAIKSFVLNLNQEPTFKNMMLMRQKLNTFLEQNDSENFSNRSTNDIAKFAEDKALINEDHYYAFSMVFHRNVCIMEYEEQIDDMSYKIWFDKKYVNHIFLLFRQISNSESDAGHIDTIIMPTSSFDISCLNLKQGFNYIAPSKKVLESCIELREFDFTHNLPNILLDNSEMYYTFGMVLADRLIETALFPIKHLIAMATELNLSASNFHDKEIDSSIDIICENMKQFELNQN
eukprot:372746_1